MSFDLQARKKRRVVGVIESWESCSLFKIFDISKAGHMLEILVIPGGRYRHGIDRDLAEAAEATAIVQLQ